MRPSRIFTPFSRLMAAYSLNELGLVMATVLIPLVILDTTGSATQAGIVSALAILSSSIAAIVAGAIADRAHPTALVRLSFGVECIGWGLIALALWAGHAHTWLLAAVAVLTAAVGAVDGPSEMVILKRIVPTERFAAATATMEARASATGLLGSPLAGLLYGLGGAVAFAVQSLLHGIGALLVPGVRAASGPHPTENTSLLRDMRHGFDIVMGQQGLRHLTVVAAIANAGMVPLSLVILTQLTVLGTSATLIGVAMSCFGVGVMLGSVVAARLAAKLTLARLLQLALGVDLACYLLLIPAGNNPWAIMALVVVAGLMLPSLNSAIMSYTLGVTPEAHVGKVFTAQAVPGMALAPLGTWLAGLTLERAGFGPTMGWIAALMGAAVLVAVLSPALRAMPAVGQLEATDSPAVP